MDLKDILSVAQCVEEINKATEERNQILSEQETRSKEFETADLENKEELTKIAEESNVRFKELGEYIASLEEHKTKLEETEKRFSLNNQLNEEKVELRKGDEKMNKDFLDSKEYRSAWVKSLKSGQPMDAEILERAGLKSTDNGVPVPTLMQGYVETAWEKHGKFSSLVRKVFYRGNLSVPVETDADDAVVHAEGTAAPAEESITLDSLIIKNATIKKWISLTDELLALSDEDFIKYIADELVYKVINKLDNSIIAGAKTDAVQGIVNEDKDLTVKVNTELDFNTHNLLMGELNFDDNIVVAMNRKTFFGTIMGMKDADGRPIFQVAIDNEGKPKYFVGGLKVEFTNALKPYDTAVANDPYMIAGYFEGYTLNMPNGDSVQTLIDPYTLAREDKEIMLGKLLCGGRVTKPLAFAVATKKVAQSKASK